MAMLSDWEISLISIKFILVGWKTHICLVDVIVTWMFHIYQNTFVFLIYIYIYIGANLFHIYHQFYQLYMILQIIYVYFAFKKKQNAKYI